MSRYRVSALERLSILRVRRMPLPLGDTELSGRKALTTDTLHNLHSHNMETAPPDGLRSRLRDQLARMPTPVVAVTCYVGGRPWGVTASSFTSVTLDPPVVSVCVLTRSPIIAPIRLQARFGISVLSAKQVHIARTLAQPGVPKFIEAMTPEADQLSEWTETVPLGTARYEQGDGHSPLPPRIYGALAVLQCTLRQAMEVGDHTLLLGDVWSVESAPGEQALVYVDRSFTCIDQKVTPPQQTSEVSSALDTARS